MYNRYLKFGDKNIWIYFDLVLKEGLNFYKIEC